MQPTVLPPPNVEEFGISTFSDCTSLTAIDMSSLTRVRKLPGNFMEGCTNLTSVLLPPNVEEFGANTFGRCTSLTSIDMSSLTGVRNLPDQFMNGCTSLTSVLLPPNLHRAVPWAWAPSKFC